MNQVKVRYIFLIAVLISGCGGVTQVAPETQIVSATPFAYSTVVPDNTTPTQVLPAGQYGAVKFSLEATRNGKTYELLIAYDIRSQGAQTPLFPQISNGDMNVNDVNVQWIGDIDVDGELEYIIETIFCGLYCSNEVQIIHYDAAIDNYRVFDSFSSYGAEKYLDIDTDGDPEVISQDYDYQFKVGGAGATRWIAPIKIYRYNSQKQRFETVTSKYPDLAIQDSKKFLEEAKSEKSNITNFLKLAAYLYDMYILGKQEEGVSIFSDVCQQYIKQTMENPDWTCEDYLVRVQETLSEMKIGSE